MFFLSTDPPPFNVSALVHLLSTTEPPRSNLRQLMAELSTEGLPLTPFHFRLRHLLALGQPAPITIPRRPAYSTTPEQDDEMARMRGQSRDVMQTLAATPLLTATRVVAPQAWDPATGIPASEVNFELNGGQTASLAAVSYADYLTSVQGVPATMSAAPAGSQLLIEAQAPYPVLFFPLALRMQRREHAQFACTYAALDVVVSWVTVTVHLLKHALGVPRPHELEQAIDPVLPVPGYAAYPSGHSTVCHAVRRVLVELTQAGTAARMLLEGLADGIALNRERAGLHCAADSAGGKALGTTMGQWLIDAAEESKSGGPYIAWSALFAAAANEWRH